jgi:hypothetical protein
MLFSGGDTDGLRQLTCDQILTTTNIGSCLDTNLKSGDFQSPKHCRGSTSKCVMSVWLLSLLGLIVAIYLLLSNCTEFL